MAKIDLKFIANDDDSIFIKVEQSYNQIAIKIGGHEDTWTICLDKSTAIKFAKTLRTEINKITD